jgi:DNA polymerase I
MNLNPKTNEAYQLLHQGILSLARAEQQGLRIDVDYIERKKIHLTRKIERLESQFKDTKFFKDWQSKVKGNININSNTQLSNYLYKIKRIRIQKETYSGAGATDEEALKAMNIPELDTLLQMRKLKKLRDTYLESFEREQVNGYIHPFFNLHLVASYRSSSDHPNFQNIPKRDEESMQLIRQAIYPRPGHQFLEIDFKSIEVSVNACYNKDSNLIKYISNPKSDMHGDMAKQIFKIDNFNKDTHVILRQAAKNGFVFPEFYGDYYINCAENMACGWGKLPKGRWSEGQGIEVAGEYLSNHMISKGITSLKKFENHLKNIERDFWENRFPEYAEWKERWWSLYKKHGYIDTYIGFRYSGVMDKKQVITYPGQGTAFHCLLWSLIQIDNVIQKKKLDTKIVNQIHDSILFDTNPDELSHIVKIAKDITSNKLSEFWDWIIVPMSVDLELASVDRPWSEKAKYIENSY